MSEDLERLAGSEVERPEPDGKVTRPRFLKQLGVTLAAAVGLASFASRAFGGTGNCCENCFQCSACSVSTCVCYCDCSQVGGKNYCFTGSPCQSGCQPCPC